MDSFSLRALSRLSALCALAVACVDLSRPAALVVGDGGSSASAADSKLTPAATPDAEDQPRPDLGSTSFDVGVDAPLAPPPDAATDERTTPADHPIPADLASPPDAPPSPLERGLVGYWRFDESAGQVARDSSGGGNSGTVKGALWRPGRFGNALYFGGNGAVVVVATPVDNRFDFGTGDFTLSAWINTTQMPSNTYPMIVTRLLVADNTHKFGYSLQTYWQNGWFSFFQIWNGTVSAGATGSAVGDGKWHHLVARKQGATIDQFFDGARKGSSPQSVGSLSAKTPLTIGSIEGAPWADYVGLIDEVRVYSRALADSEIMSLAAGAGL